MGFEPTTCALRVRCSATELPGQRHGHSTLARRHVATSSYALDIDCESGWYLAASGRRVSPLLHPDTSWPVGDGARRLRALGSSKRAASAGSLADNAVPEQSSGPGIDAGPLTDDPVQGLAGAGSLRTRIRSGLKPPRSARSVSVGIGSAAAEQSAGSRSSAAPSELAYSSGPASSGPAASLQAR